MPTVAMIVPVYNEEKLLPEFISNVNKHMDQLIFVDGSVDGSSTDRTSEIISNFMNEDHQCSMVQTSGKFAMASIWNKNAQLKAGIESVNCDYVCISSADMLYTGLDDIAKALEEKPDVIYGNVIEFWLDTKHIRKSSGFNVGQNYSMVCKTSHAKRYILGESETKAIHEIVYLANMTMYHYGWIRPFAEQINKHVRNVMTGGWGEIGLKLIQRGVNVLESWAIYHILNYRDGDFVRAIVNAPGWNEMTCFDGLIEFSETYQKKHKENMYHRIMKYIPHDLLVAK